MRLLLALVAVITGALWLAPDSAMAHGNLDQSLEGDPGCNTSNFGASVMANGGQRQQFIPSGTLLSSVGLCVSAAASNTPLVVAIYGPQGTLVGGGSTANNPSVPDSAGPPVRFVHVDFIAPFSVAPGEVHTIEISAGATITWYGTASGSPYSYCLGAPNTSAVGDFGFQLYVADAVGSSPACPVPPTATAVPPTSTPVLQASNTPQPGATNAPANTPAPGETAVAQPTAVTGTTADGSSGPGTGGSTAGNTSQPSASGGQALPNAGGGMEQSRDALPWFALALLLGVAGALLIAGRRSRA